jgi:hypothetical protein
MENLSLISIYCGGVLSLLMGIFHTQYYKLFKWKKEFDKITETNKNILYTIHIALLLLFFGIAVVSLLNAKELSLCVGISFGINLMYAMFWLWRTIWQILYFKPDKNSKLLPLHYILIAYFSLLLFTYLLPIILKLVLMI